MGLITKWGRLLGSDSYEWAIGAVPAADGSVYVAGTTYGSFGNQVNSGSYDVFLAKYSATGDPLWTVFLGTDQAEYANSLAVAADGSVYVAGSTSGDLDGQSNHGEADAFLTKYTSDGVRLWTRLQGSFFVRDTANAIATGADGSIYVAGSYWGEMDNQPYGGLTDALITKYSADGQMLWTRLLGSNYDDSAYSVAIAGSDSVCIAGVTNGGFDGHVNYGRADVFVSMYSASGDRLWTRFVASASNDYPFSIATAADGSVYLAGRSGGINEAPNQIDGQINHGSADVLICKFSANGQRLWTRLIGSAGWDEAFAITTLPDGSFYLAGNTDGDFEGQPGNGSREAFISQYTADGERLWTRLVGSASFYDSAKSITASGDGSIVISGSTTGQLNGQMSHGSQDAFLISYRLADGPEYGPSLSTDAAAEGDGFSLSVLTKEVDPGTLLFYCLGGTGITAADFSAGQLTGYAVVDDAGALVLPYVLAQDYKTEGDETLSLSLFLDQDCSQQVGPSLSLVIRDSSTDTLVSSESIKLPRDYKNLSLTGSAAINGTGNSRDNTLTGNGADNKLNGGAGADTMIGAAGDDKYVVERLGDVVREAPGDGVDTVYASVTYSLPANVDNLVLGGVNALDGNGNSLPNRMMGNTSVNRLVGDAGSDVIKAGDGDDSLIGGLGKDLLTGGQGSDCFIYRSMSESGEASALADVISDFKPSQADRVDLSAIDASPAKPGNQAFVYRGAADFTGAEGEVRFASGILWVRTDASGLELLTIELPGVMSLNSDALIL